MVVIDIHTMGRLVSLFAMFAILSIHLLSNVVIILEPFHVKLFFLLHVCFSHNVFILVIF